MGSARRSRATPDALPAPFIPLLAHATPEGYLRFPGRVRPRRAAPAAGVQPPAAVRRRGDLRGDRGRHVPGRWGATGRRRSTSRQPSTTSIRRGKRCWAAAMPTARTCWCCWWCWRRRPCCGDWQPGGRARVCGTRAPWPRACTSCSPPTWHATTTLWRPTASCSCCCPRQPRPCCCCGRWSGRPAALRLLTRHLAIGVLVGLSALCKYQGLTFLGVSAGLLAWAVLSGRSPGPGGCPGAAGPGGLGCSCRPRCTWPGPRLTTAPRPRSAGSPSTSPTWAPDWKGTMAIRRGVWRLLLIGGVAIVPYGLGLHAAAVTVGEVWRGARRRPAAAPGTQGAAGHAVADGRRCSPWPPAGASSATTSICCCRPCACWRRHRSCAPGAGALPGGRRSPACVWCPRWASSCRPPGRARWPSAGITATRRTRWWLTGLPP